MSNFYTSDSHLFHKNICGPDGFESKRIPFLTVEDMNEELIRQWNNVVKYDDDVFHLGDFFMYTSKSKCVEIINRLNGRIHWIAGNHDSFKNSRSILRAFDGTLIKGQPKLQFYEMGLRQMIDEYTVYLCHYGLLTGARPKVFSVHGHIHSTETMYPNHINVGVDNIEPEFQHLPFGQPIHQELLMSCIKQREQFMIDNDLYNNRDHPTKQINQ